ncbi:hypothetical protein ECE50_005650 [Chitinophaga sp. Mgbs1]|uniref:Uncharacterized protein n=1 Tax=Chitinophaga solisilvae TaxID=1233460 RepID=A0A433WGD0_9BACT|nr:hypothetical protein [Chitinophaga solisilvae]
MKGFWNYFWLLYMLFFAIPFPMIIYYNVDYGVREQDGGTAPRLALVWLAVSVILWGIVLQKWFRKWILLPFIMRKDVLRLLRHGVLKTVKILSSRAFPLTRDHVVPMEMKIALQNFSGTEITEKIELNDSRPELRRYEEGKSFQMRIDEHLKAQPYMIPEDVQVGIRAGRIILSCLFWLLIVAAVIAYYIISYELENYGTGWRFLKFYHPLLLCPLILLVSSVGLGWLIRSFTGNPDNDLKLKYYGVRTIADITSVEQTGLYINEQPQVRFEIKFQDNTGRTHYATIKKIVSLLDVGFTKVTTAPVLYLKDRPDQVIFVSDVEA